MSRNNNSLSTAAQLGYIVEWFREWSELQREDFVPILAEKINSNGVFVNGIYNSMQSLNLDKPMSLFQCRIKLFNEWYIGWAAEDKEKLLKQLIEVDETFGKKIQDELSGDKGDDEDFMRVTVQEDQPIVERNTPNEPEAEEEIAITITDDAPSLESGEFHSEVVQVN